MNQIAVDINMTIFEDNYSTELKICVGLFSPILIFVIIFLYWGIIYYEKFGHDPLKRDLSNMLFSSFCKSISIGTAIFIVVTTIRTIFGPILNSISVVCYYLSLNFVFYWHFVNYEILIYKFMTMCTKANIVNINYAIWHSILNQTNMMYAFLLSTVIVQTTEPPFVFPFLSGTLIMFDKMNIQLPLNTL